jgi:Fe-Mn family superoxide dismutase
MKFELPKLEYGYDAMEPYLDKQTMEIHYGKHHQTYLDKFNAVLEKYPDLNFAGAEEYLINLDNLPVEESDRAAIKNMGGGFVNHNLYWQSMAPQKASDAGLIDAIKIDFGSLEDFKVAFTKVAVSHFASGWAWLVRDENNNLKIYSLPNQDSPYSLGHKPVFCLDLWEHAYYLKYQNRRPEFVENWWQVLKYF